MASSVILLKILISGVLIVAGSILVIWGTIKGFHSNLTLYRVGLILDYYLRRPPIPITSNP